MPMTLADAAGRDDRNAAYLAKACDLAYYAQGEAAPKFLEELGLAARLVAAENTQAYVGTSDDAVVVAFRGSENPASIDGFKDWLLTNANNFLILPEGRIGTDFAAAGVGARFHRGFMEALADIWEPLLAEVERVQGEKERPLWITGHSLGGGLALLAAWRLQRNFLAVHQVYTFGAPMTGNAAAAEAFQKEFPNKIFRYIDHMDLVPLLPTVSLIANAYGHCEAEHVLGGDGQSEAVPADGLLKSMVSSTVDGLLHATIIDDIWGHLRLRLASHMMSNYAARIAEGSSAR